VFAGLLAFAVLAAGAFAAGLLAEAFATVFAALAIVFAALAAVFAALAIVLAALAIVLAVVFALFALAFALLAGAVSPQAIPRAPSARTDESAITFFITIY
jgi:hypothetical protein